MLFSVVSVLLLVFNIDTALCLNLLKVSKSVGIMGVSPPVPSWLYGKSKPAACGVTMGCFTDGCDTNGDNCDRVVTWVDSTSSVTFTLSLATSGTADIWVALGLSLDNSMGDDSVTDCIATGTSVAVTKSYNTGRVNAALSSATSGLSATSGSIANGVLMCTFTQTKTNSDAKIFDLSTPWYLLVANGAASGGVKIQHTTTPIRSADLQSIVIPVPTIPLIATSNFLSKSRLCGVTMGCFTDGCDTNGDNCDLVVAWVDSPSSVTFSLNLLTTGTADIWVALGLSSDSIMGADSVTDCIATGTSVAVTKSYNTGRVNAALNSALTSGLSATSGSIANGVLRCIYTQTKTNSDAKIFDLNTSWYLLVANGAASGGTKTQHTTIPIRSTAAIDVESYSSAASKITVKHTAIILTVMAFVYNYISY